MKDTSPLSHDGLGAALYAELHRLAHRYMQGERSGHTLQTTALVHEAYLRLAAIDGVPIRDRRHYVAMAATMMRRILVDHARARGRAKRGAAVQPVSLHEVPDRMADPIDLIALDDALERLSQMDPQLVQVVELRYFGGLTLDETADALEVSPATVKRAWAIARAWLHQELSA